MKRTRLILDVRAAVIFACCILFSVEAQSAFEQRAVGARAIALGGTFTAAQDDVGAIYWNPAALGTLTSSELEFMYQDLYSKGLVNFTHLGFAYPGIGPGGFGISWTRFGVTKKVPLNYNENTFTIGYGMTLWDRVSAGASFNYFRLNSELNASGFGMNAGLQYRPFQWLCLGSAFSNMLRTNVRYEGGSIDVLPSDVRVGTVLTYKVVKMYLDLDKLQKRTQLLHTGAEYSILRDRLIFRGGISRRVANDFNWVYSLGFGAKVKLLSLDYAFENHFDLGPSHIVSIKWRFKQ